jgi:hypothetical protein
MALADKVVLWEENLEMDAHDRRAVLRGRIDCSFSNCVD